MEVLLAVIDDLWRFARYEMFGFRTVNGFDRELENQTLLPLPAETKIKQEVKTGDLLNELTWQTTANTDDLRAGDQYYVADIETYLYTDPVIAFGTSVKQLPYGQPVILKKVGGRWAQVETAKETGWVLKDVLALRKTDVYPSFVIDEVYDARHSETVKLRGYINDEFCGARADLPLSGAEFVTYKLRSLHIEIPWPKKSARVPGVWQVKLRGLKGVYMNVLPKTHSIMEYTIDEVGYLAFVEAVFPDRSIKISEVGFPEDGYYREAIMTQEEYRELKPVFITCS